MKSPINEELLNQLLSRRSLWLFLDYDGTLAEFAPTPETIDPDPLVNNLLARLALQTGLRLAVISGRRLRDVQALLSVPGIYFAGTYGVELQTPDGKVTQRVQRDAVRPFLETVKPLWEKIIGGKKGFYIEDKDWALALHAKLVDDADANQVLTLAREVVEHGMAKDQFRVLDGYKFLEVASLLANKGKTVSYLLDHYPMSDSQPLYIGDDDRDEEAFEVVNERGGVSIKVVRNAEAPYSTKASYILDSPSAVCAWLEMLFARRKELEKPG